jgi:hypothetical protein
MTQPAGLGRGDSAGSRKLSFYASCSFVCLRGSFVCIRGSSSVFVVPDQGFSSSFFSL